MHPSFSGSRRSVGKTAARKKWRSERTRKAWVGFSQLPRCQRKDEFLISYFRTFRFLSPNSSFWFYHSRSSADSMAWAKSRTCTQNDYSFVFFLHKQITTVDSLDKRRNWVVGGPSKVRIWQHPLNFNIKAPWRTPNKWPSAKTCGLRIHASLASTPDFQILCLDRYPVING